MGKAIPRQTELAVIKAIGQKKTHRQISRMYNLSVGMVSKIRNKKLSRCLPTKKNKDHPYELNIPSLRKTEIVWLWKHRCKHGQRYMHHPKCFFEEKGGIIDEERIGFLDIETTNLQADYGIVICYCIKPSDSDQIIERCVTPKEVKTVLDEKVIRQCMDDLYQFDRVCAHFGCYFDVPFLRSRALYHKIPFIERNDIWYSDTWKMAKKLLKLSSNRLKTIGEFFNLETEKTKITTEHWLGSLQGKQESLDYVLDHCRRDVIVLEDVFRELRPYALCGNTSI